MNKRIRDRAISSSPTVLTATYKGEDWYTDSFMATKYPILDGYTPRKHQIDTTEKPELDTIIDDGREYSLAEFEETNEDITSVRGWSNIKLATRYINLIKNIYPSVLPFITTDVSLAPVKFYNGEELVAVVMPIR